MNILNRLRSALSALTTRQPETQEIIQTASWTVRGSEMRSVTVGWLRAALAYYDKDAPIVFRTGEGWIWFIAGVMDRDEGTDEPVRLLSWDEAHAIRVESARILIDGEP